MDSNSIMQKISEEFIIETFELLQIVSNSILDLEKSSDLEVVNSIYRVFHTIKGNAYLAGYASIGRLSHKVEDVLAIIKAGGIEINSELIDYFLNTTDMIKLMAEDAEKGGDATFDTDKLITFFDGVIAAVSEVCEKGLEEEQENQYPEPCSNIDVSGIDSSGTTCNSRTKDDFLGNLAKNSFRPLKILVVEDDFTSRQLLVAALSRYGDCHIAKDGLEAVQAVIESYESAPTTPYDLICMDVQMPNMDGTVASKTIREIERGKDVEGTEFESIIIMISCVEDAKVIMKACYHCGANHYFVKPLDLNQMTRQMQKLGLISVDKPCATV